MRNRIIVLGLVAALFGLMNVPDAKGQDQSEVVVAASSLNVASDVINGSVLATQSVESGAGEVHTLALVDVQSAVQGSLSGQIFVEVPGGQTVGGLQVVVSHQPSFRVGDSVQLALVRAPADEEALLTAGQALYSVVGGTDGATAVSGSLLDQAQAAGDFALTGTKWNTMPIEYHIRTTNSGVGSTATRNALQRAMNDWVADPGSDIDFTYRGATSASPTDYYDAYNTIGWQTTPNSADQFLAQAVWLVGSNGTVGFDIQFNRDYQWASGAASGKFDIETVNLHEVGHVLGLAHTTANTAEVMYPSILSNTTKNLGAGDRSGVASLYPAANPPPSGGGLCDGKVVTIDMNTNGGEGTGTPGNDVILGTDGDDVIDAGGGDDTICAEGGADKIHAGPGNDMVVAGVGVDRVWGGDGDDEIYGGPDRDIIVGENGKDMIFGGSGRDSLYGGPDPDVIDGGADTDLIRGEAGADTLRSGSSGNDRIVGGSGNDRIDASATTGSTRLIGDDGHDVIVGSSQLDRIWGSTGNDNIRGGGYSDLIRGGAGNDKIYGENGKDTLDGGDGADTLFGGSDPDKMVGMAGTDSCDGGQGLGDAAHWSCEKVSQVP